MKKINLILKQLLNQKRINLMKILAILKLLLLPKMQMSQTYLVLSKQGSLLLNLVNNRGIAIKNNFQAA